MKNTYLIFFIIVSLFLYTCKSKYNENNEIQYNLIENKYAKGFSIYKNDSITKISIFNPWQNSSDVKFEYYLSSNPEHEKLFPKNRFIKTPVKNIICFSTTHIAFINLLKEQNSLKACSGCKYIFDSILLKKYENREILEIGYSQNIDYEQVLSTNPDVIFIYSIEGEAQQIINKLNTLNIPTIVIGDYMENNPLGKTEWIKVFAEFYNKPNIADKFFNNTCEEYNKTKQLLTNIKKKPIVMLNAPFQGNWTLPSNDSYIVKLLEDAGGEYFFKHKKGNNSFTTDMETIISKSENAEFWLNTGQAKNSEELILFDKKIKNLPKLKELKIYNNNARISYYGGNDYWESGILYPQIILSDMIKILHPKILTDKNLYYYKKIK